MGGGLMQLVAYGAQDIYLTGNPQITFFKVVYRRHTNFSMEAIEQTWSGTSGGSGASIPTGRCTATISRNGDLVHRMYLEVDGVDSTGNDALKVARNPMGLAIVDVEIEIGGQKIDKHTGDWMNVWTHLSEPNPSGHTGTTSAANLAGGTLVQNLTGMGGFLSAEHDYRFYVPLQFWFCRNPGLALPLIALQYHEVKVILNHAWGEAFDEGTVTNTLWCDYIYLDTDERRRFAQVSHEYLIEQVQEQTLALATGSNDLNFNHPVKELIWVKDSDIDQAVGTSGIGTTVSTFQLKLNGHDRFAARNYQYFSRTQIYQHHSGPGGLQAAVSTSNVGAFNDAIGVYSFALKPEEHQPSGTCNFSRIDNAQLVGSAGCQATVCYAVNYNVLRIMSGMGGLAYSN